ncbi:MAG: hypothetical protein J4224_00640 [Candidatus Diapherotrites archaeon]|uniref:Uncharacterized protein n=1 Tax=Candidatus Iainarchaeum sp. TaxID=3101447 RepID=A0A7J4ISD4_9ARCH|nr:MAG: hypothetical protein QT03_C0001G0949 [archaeon GW2011_AR10]MBS3058915.1 hypothetical protein [Candidatus Diapherotrites archaeon]HIH08418.1 hypothetical protein [Candidatus Diapherotrites archaeon]
MDSFNLSGHRLTNEKELMDGRVKALCECLERGGKQLADSSMALNKNISRE